MPLCFRILQPNYKVQVVVVAYIALLTVHVVVIPSRSKGLGRPRTVDLAKFICAPFTFI